MLCSVASLIGAQGFAKSITKGNNAKKTINSLFQKGTCNKLLNKQLFLDACFMTH